ncbi:hypothetical protein BSQ44_04235 [Aquibium oceanicum]|uniref:Uncharacterized protein n=1 Tax=Aquibium oceanicum TaxID=1670800 RepID=A0A1L3SMR2_9HYPH|nr:hypothetical protein BSQ44_04235 [Aquibium oceanicum]
MYCIPSGPVPGIAPDPLITRTKSSREAAPAPSVSTVSKAADCRSPNQIRGGQVRRAPREALEPGDLRRLVVDGEMRHAA